MTTLDVALDRLIHKRTHRRDFVDTGRIADVEAEDRDALAAIDRVTLAELAERVARGVFSRKHSGSGSLLDLFPHTIEAYRNGHPEDEALVELAYAFMDSPAFDDYREHPFSGPGSSLEDSFFRYCERAGIGDAVAREHEFLAASMKLLAVSPRAAVAIPECVRTTHSGWFCVSSRGAPTLYAAVRGRFVTGRLTPFLADLLVPGADGAATARRHGVSSSVLDESVRRLSALGILEARG